MSNFTDSYKKQAGTCISCEDLCVYKIDKSQIRINWMKHVMSKDVDMPKICLRYVWDMPDIFPRYALDLPEIYLRYNWILPNITEKCLRNTWYIPKIYMYMRYAWDIPEKCHRCDVPEINDKPNICLRHTRLIPKIYQKYA